MSCNIGSAPPPPAGGCGCASTPVKVEAVPAYNKSASCLRKEAPCPGKCPPMPCSEISGCLPNWLCTPPKTKYPQYPAPPGANILPISVGGRNSSIKVGTIASEIACSSRSRIQAFGDIPIQLLPMNFLIPPIPRCHDQPDCHIRLKPLFKEESEPVADNVKPSIRKPIVLKGQQKVAAPGLKPVESYCEAVDALCSAVEGLLLRVNPSTISKVKVFEPLKDSKEISPKALGKIDQFASKSKREPGLIASKVGLVRKSVTLQFQNENKNTITVGPGPNSRLRPRSKPDLRTQNLSKATVKQEQDQLGSGSGNQVLKAASVFENAHSRLPKRSYSAHHTKHLIEIPTPDNPFLSMTWITATDRNNVTTGNSQSRPIRSRSLNSRPRPVASGFSNRPPTVATQTSDIFRTEDYTSDCAGGKCGESAGGAGAPNVANKNCPMVRPYCQKKEEPAPAGGGGFFSKLGSLFGGGKSDK